MDAWARPGRAHRRVAYVAGEPFLWPALTGAETFEFLARVRGGTDGAYRDAAGRALPARHRQAGARAVEGQPPEGAADRGASPRRAELLLLDEPTSGPRSADGGGVPRDRHGGQGARADGVPLLAHPQRGRGALRPRGDPARRAARRRGHARELRHLSAQTVEVTFAGPPPSLGSCPACSVAGAGANALRFEVSGQRRRR